MNAKTLRDALVAYTGEAGFEAVLGGHNCVTLMDRTQSAEFKRGDARSLDGNLLSQAIDAIDDGNEELWNTVRESVCAIDGIIDIGANQALLRITNDPIVTSLTLHFEGELREVIA